MSSNTLNSVINSNMELVFMGGKGGVGKTTCSCALALLMANTPWPNNDNNNNKYRRVLLVSTDPAHNLSDAFNQKINKFPTLIKNVPHNNLFAMEIEASSVIHGQISHFFNKHQANDTENNENNDDNNNIFSSLKTIITQLSNSFPGIDELSVFSEIITSVNHNKNNATSENSENCYDVILFDTAPTGHTLRLLALPSQSQLLLNQVLNTQGLDTILGAASTFMQQQQQQSSNDNNNNNNSNSAGGEVMDYRGKLESWLDIIKQVQETFQNYEKTIFICVCIAEFLSVYETERLVQSLMKYDINCEHIIVNQLLLKPLDGNTSSDNNNNVSNCYSCQMCESRRKIQNKYLRQIEDLYAEDFSIIKLPLCTSEVRGIQALETFSQLLIQPYDPQIHGII